MVMTMKTLQNPFLVLKQQSRLYMGAAEELLEPLLQNYRQVIFITDPTVALLHASLMKGRVVIRTPEGEAYKRLESVEQIYRELIAHGADRHTFILAVGGGIVCDMAGFAASTFMRGLHFGFVPTTLLGQVDASVGGKNGVNLAQYKNMVGCFSQPDFVLCDPALLATLSDREFRCGMAEVIKMAILGDEELFGALEQRTIAQIRSDRAFTEWMIGRCIAQKAAVVERDEREQDERRKLNLGHTFAHAIEHCLPELHHGEAVAIGLVMAADMAEARGLLNPLDKARIRALVERMELPCSVDIASNYLKEAMRQDKKSQGDSIAWILPRRIGACEILSIPLDEVL